VQAYLDEEPIMSENDKKEKKTKDVACVSKFTKATLNAHCLLDVDPGKYNLDFKAN